MTPTKGKPAKTTLIRAFFLLVSCIVMVATCTMTLSRKEALFLDEYSSYGCANGGNGKKIPFEDNVTYTREEVRRLALDTYGVAEDGRFHYGAVWRNLGENVHPPVFYAALHTASSLTPGVFSIWQAAVVNMLFGLASLFFFYGFTRAFVHNEWAAGILCVIWAGTQGLCANIILLRDYAAAMLGTLATAWAFFRFLRGDRKTRDLVLVATAFAFSILSHYYCIIYLAFLCAVTGGILIIRKEWKAIRKLAVAAILAVLAAVAVFPAMIGSILVSRRGKQAADNFVNGAAGNFVDSCKAYYAMINRSFFGGWLPWIAVGLVAILVARMIVRRKQRGVRVQNDGQWFGTAEVCMLAIPAILYFFVVVKIAPYRNIRYLYPVTTILYLSVMATLVRFGRDLSMRRTGVLTVVLCVMMAGISGMSWVRGHFDFLYEGRREKLERLLAPLKGRDAVQIWNAHRQLVCLTLDAAKYFGTMTYCCHPSEETLKSISVLKQGKDAVVILSNNDVGMLERLREIYPHYSVDFVGPKARISGRHKWIYYHFHGGDGKRMSRDDPPTRQPDERKNDHE